MNRQWRASAILAAFLLSACTGGPEPEGSAAAFETPVPEGDQAGPADRDAAAAAPGERSAETEDAVAEETETGSPVMEDDGTAVGTPDSSVHSDSDEESESDTPVPTGTGTGDGDEGSPLPSKPPPAAPSRKIPGREKPDDMKTGTAAAAVGTPAEGDGEAEVGDTSAADTPVPPEPVSMSVPDDDGISGPAVPVNPLLVEDRPYTAGTTAEPDDGSDDGTSEDVTGNQAVRTGTPSRQDAENRSEADPVERVANPSENAGVDVTLLDDPAALQAESAASPSRWLDGPGEFSVVLDGPGWVFRSDLSTPGDWRFLARERDGESTRFDFLFTETGRWNLVFERQDLSSGGAERVSRGVRVGEDARPIVENGPPAGDGTGAASGDMPSDPQQRARAAGEAAAAGRPEEAIALREKDAGRDDAAGREAREAIMELAVATGTPAPLVTWLPAYLDDDPDPQILAGALELLERRGGYGTEEAMVLEALAGNRNDPRRAEWLYRLARRLERPGEGRDMDRAAALYGEVVEGWPFSEWRDLSEERIAWLQRHYFRVR